MPEVVEPVEGEDVETPAEQARSRSILEKVKRAREPIASVVLLVVALNLGLGIAHVAMPRDGLSLLGRMKAEGGMAMGLISLLVLLAAAGACVLVRPSTRHARIIALIGAALAAVATLFAAVNLVGGLMSGGQGVLGSLLEGLGGLIDLVLKGVTAYLLFVMARKMPQLEEFLAKAPVEELLASTSEPAIWQPREAAGVRWNSAREAAASYVPASRPATAPTAGDVAGSEPSTAVVARPVEPADDPLTGPAAQASVDLWKPHN